MTNQNSNELAIARKRLQHIESNQWSERSELSELLDERQTQVLQSDVGKLLEGLPFTWTPSIYERIADLTQWEYPEALLLQAEIKLLGADGTKPDPAISAEVLLPKLLAQDGLEKNIKSEAQYLIGKCCDSHPYYSRLFSGTREREWYREAMNSGSIRGAIALAYHIGSSRAVFRGCLNRAYELGHMESGMLLAGDFQNISDSETLWKKMANQDYVPAIIRLAEHYLSRGSYVGGYAQEEKINQARVAYKKAASLGSSDAIVWVTLDELSNPSLFDREPLLQTLRSSIESASRSYSYYKAIVILAREECKNGNIAAYRQLLEQVSTANHFVPIIYFKCPADLLFDLAEMYENGISGEANADKALELHRRAAQDGENRAISLLNQLNITYR
jgi:TPR repeat protein